MRTQSASSPRLVKQRPATIIKRREILDAAMEIFGSKGFANGTLIDIAEQVGMTHAGILHHFGSKDQLLLEVLQHRDDSDVADLDEQHIPDGLPLFRHLVRTAVANAGRPGIVQAYVVFSAESVTEGHPGREFFRARYVTLRGNIINAFLVVCAQAGVTSQETIDDASASIVAVMDGLQVQWLLDPEKVDIARATQFAIEAIVSAVISPQESPLDEKD